MAQRLEPADEYPHDAGGEADFAESVGVFLYDPSGRVGGLLRMTVRPGQARAATAVCLYLPDGRVAFGAEETGLSDSSGFSTAGLRFGVVRPFEELEASYRGRLMLLDDPLTLGNPEVDRSCPHEDASVELTFTALAPAFGHEAGGRYEQLSAAIGAITVGDTGWEVDGYGVRDHRWGPAAGPASSPYRRWLTGNCGPAFGFAASWEAREDGPAERWGFVWDGTALNQCNDIDISTGWLGEDNHHDTVQVVMRTVDQEWRIDGKVLSLVPRQDRTGEPAVRTDEALTRWSTADDRVGYGISEYVDRIIDGRPVGAALTGGPEGRGS